MQSAYIFPKKEVDLQNYYYWQQGFTKEELIKVYNSVTDVPFQKATIVGGGEDISSIRSSSIKWIPQNDQWNWLYDKMMTMAKEANDAIWNFDLQSAPEAIQYTEYYDHSGGHYGWHQDIGPGMLSHRKISVTVQLSESDEYEGGDLEYWRGGDSWETAPRGAGVVFIFPSYMMHRVTQVTKGTRKSFVIWLGGEHYR